ncbi:MAG: RsmB/NOP family class I SAM-dependent RNA methyltransferase [Candidatus Kapaibacterium sp.]
MQSSSLLGHSAELLRIIRKSPQPADLLTSSYMRERKYIGASDRRAISAVVFHAQRVMESADELWRRAVQACQASGSGAGSEPIAGSVAEMLSTIPIDAGCISAALVLCEQWNAVSVLEPFLRSVPIATEQTATAQTATEPAATEPAGNGDARPWNTAVIRFLAEKYVLEKQSTEKHSSHKDYSSLSTDACSAVCDAIRMQFDSLLASDTPADIALCACLPEWMVRERLYQPYSGATSDANHVREFGLSFVQPAPLCLRVNTRVATREQVLRALRNENIDCTPSGLSPHGIIVHERVRLTQHALMNSGAIEVQDEGSQMVGYACNPQPKQRILDACSGAGGKALHLAVLQDDQGEIMASDSEPKRMRELNTRMRTANLQSIRVQALLHLDESARARLEGSFDIVLVDAPCSGLGTIRRTPMLKWRTSEAAIERLHEKQTRIIQEYARYVKRGGVLVYVTCSVIRKENEDVIQSFLATNTEFVPDALQPHFAAHGCDVPGCSEQDFMLRLDPLHSGTDGFFIARMKRVAHDASLTSENS